jgi:hypothetical protein
LIRPVLRRLSHFARRHRRALIAGVVPLLLWMTWVDGVRVATAFTHGQAVATAVCLFYWLALYGAGSARLRRLMLFGVVAATAGEALFSLGLGMYTYREGGIPLYVPPGHTVLYAAVFLFVRLPGVHHRARLLMPVLLALGAAYSAVQWRLFADDYGFACFLVFLVLLTAIRGSRLFFAAMYLLVAWLEQCGTGAGAWAWPDHLLGRAHGLSSANPPAGVAVFYCLFDLSCLAMYFGWRFKTFERWVQRLVWRRGKGGLSPLFGAVRR